MPRARRRSPRSRSTASSAKASPSEQILKLIDEDADIGILVLAAGLSADDPGPLVSNVGKFAGTFPIPLAIVPGHLSDEDIDASS